MEEKENFYHFMEDYISFFDKMIEVQKTQLEAILSKQVKQVEKSVASLQTFLMKFESMEKKRMELQEQAGYCNMTFSQIVEDVSETQKQNWQTLFETMEKKVSDVAYYNAKCQEKVKLDLKVWGNDTVNAISAGNAGGYTANKKQVDSARQSSLFKAKV